MLSTKDVRRLVTELEEGVMGDGFDGYFFNSESDPSAALVALDAISAEATARIVREAYAKFPGGMPPADRFARQKALLEQVSPDGNAFEREEAEFFRYPEDLQQLISRYEQRASG